MQFDDLPTTLHIIREYPSSHPRQTLLLVLGTIAFAIMRYLLYVWVDDEDPSPPSTATTPNPKPRVPAKDLKTPHRVLENSLAATRRVTRKLEDMGSRMREKMDASKPFDVVLAKELECIAERRRMLDLPPLPEMVSSSAQHALPEVGRGLVGLALSGGGIRAATFALGLTQALAKYGALKHIDYLSTVSGGGFFGSCLVSLLSSPDLEGKGADVYTRKAFPLTHELGARESIAMRWLRKKSANYMGRGLVDSLLIPVLIVRGFLLNLLIIFPLMWGIILLRDNLFHTTDACLAADGPDFELASCFRASSFVGTNFLIHLLLFPFLARPVLGIYFIFALSVIFQDQATAVFSFLLASPWTIASVAGHLYLVIPPIFNVEPTKLWYNRSFGWMALFLIGSLFFEALSLFEHVWRVTYSQEWSTSYHLIGLSVLLISDSFAVSLITESQINPVKQAVFSWFVLISGPFLLAYYYLELHGVLLGKPLLGTEHTLCAILAIFSLFCIDLNETSLHRMYRDRVSRAFLFTLRSKSGLASGAPAAVAQEGAVPYSRARVALFGNTKLSQTNPHNLAPYHIINATLNLDRDTLSLMGRGSDFFMFSREFVGSAAVGYRETTVMERADRNLDLATAVSISGAAMAPHMGASTIESLILSLGVLNIRLGYWLPNPASVILSSTVLSRFFYGFSWYMLMKEFGWPPMKKTDYRLLLSDGGHSDNVGAMELLRRRCKYLIVCDAEADPDYRYNGLAILTRLARVEFGCTLQIRLDGITPPVLPDGELGKSRRHWAIGRIVYHKNAADASRTGPDSDSDDDDAQVEVEVEVEAEAKTTGRRVTRASSRRKTSSSRSTTSTSASSGTSGRASATTLPPGEVGYFLYIKTSITPSVKDVVITEYKASSPSFPHESTSDQYFSDAQFEAYRALGFQAAGKALFGGPLESRFDGHDLQAFFAALYQEQMASIPLPEPWREVVDPATGMVYFETQDGTLKTWTDPRK